LSGEKKIIEVASRSKGRLFICPCRGWISYPTERTDSPPEVLARAKFYFGAVFLKGGGK